jgi:CubicO group peptidase (beta-lactamase class C family)
LYKKNFYDSIDVIKKRYLNALLSDSIKKKKNPEFNAKKELLKIYKRYYSNHYIKDSSEIKIAENMFFRKNYMDTLWKKTKQLRVYSRKIYQYSDINMILLQIAIDSLNRQSIDKYVKNQFYLPMGLKTMCFKPADYFSKSSITPTENEQYWREQTLRGDVHDPSAAMLGRVAGNAGLFSNAYDLAVLAQMWLNGGTYGGRRYISESTVKLFTGFQEESHRGLGFDKPSKQSIIGNGAPKESYGHTGFTGTCVWVDPINEIVFVFLSNRVHPNQKNWMINKLKIRQKIHSVVYEAICKAS